MFNYINIKTNQHYSCPIKKIANLVDLEFVNYDTDEVIPVTDLETPIEIEIEATDDVDSVTDADTETETEDSDATKKVVKKIARCAYFHVTNDTFQKDGVTTTTTTPKFTCKSTHLTEFTVAAFDDEEEETKKENINDDHANTIALSLVTLAGIAFL